MSTAVSIPSGEAQRNHPWKHVEFRGADPHPHEAFDVFCGCVEVRRVKKETAPLSQDKIHSTAPPCSPFLPHLQGAQRHTNKGLSSESGYCTTGLEKAWLVQNYVRNPTTLDQQTLCSLGHLSEYGNRTSTIEKLPGGCPLLYIIFHTHKKTSS